MWEKFNTNKSISWNEFIVTKLFLFSNLQCSITRDNILRRYTAYRWNVFKWSNHPWRENDEIQRLRGLGGAHSSSFTNRTSRSCPRLYVPTVPRSMDSSARVFSKQKQRYESNLAQAYSWMLAQTCSLRISHGRDYDGWSPVEPGCMEDVRHTGWAIQLRASLWLQSTTLDDVGFSAFGQMFS